MIEQTVKILLLEDLSTDQILLKRQVQKQIPNAVFTIADSKESFTERLKWGTYDVILSDYNIPGYNGLEALLSVREKMPHVPFIFITGTLNDEERVAHAILSGASGYVLKQNIKELPAYLMNVLEDSQAANSERKAQQEKEIERDRLLNKLEALINKVEQETTRKELLAVTEDMKNL
jgi:CheY-like chemotaxis protein